MLEFTVAILLVLVWLSDRASVRRRLEALEAELVELRRANVAVRAPGPVVQPGSPPAPQTPAVPPRVIVPPTVIVPARAAVPTVHAAAPPARAEPSVEPRDSYERAAPLDALRRERAAAARTLEHVPDSTLPPWLKELLTGGNLIVRVGVVVLFFGVAFLLRYVAEHSHLSIEWRLSGVAVFAIVLLAFGWRWRNSRRNYALALQGAGVGVLYLTVFAALRLFSVLSAGAAFFLLAAVAALSATLAILQDSMAFAMLGAIGGYLAPVLTAKPHGDHVALFSYFALLDLAVVGIAWFRSWRPLNLLAFVFTYGIGTAWGVLRYQPENFATTEPFVALFFLMFVAITVLFALRRAPVLLHYVDGTLVFGVPVVTLALQAGLVRHIPYALAYSALTLAAFYVLLAWLLHQRRRESLQLLVEAFIALGAAFATLAIPLALEGRWTAATWALEGAAVLWVGLRQDRRLAVFAGAALQVLAGIAYFCESTELVRGESDLLVANSRFLAAVLISAAGLAIAARLRRPGKAWIEPWRAALSDTFFVWASLWWLSAGFWEIDRHVAASSTTAGDVLFIAASAALASLLGERLAWSRPRALALLLFPGLALLAFGGSTLPHPLAFGGWWAWPLGFAAGYVALRRDESVAPAALRSALHTIAFWLLVWLATAEIAWQVARAVGESSTWAAATRGLVPALALFVALRGVSWGRWPFATQRAYAGVAAAGLVFWLWAWGLYSDAASDGTASPLPYVPLLNPMDAAQGIALVAILTALKTFAAGSIAPPGRTVRQAVRLLVAFAVFAWLNVLLLRTLHHYAAVPYTLEAMEQSTVTQTALTIFWTSLALAGMTWASRSGQRIAWVTGAVLLTTVIGKLFLVDLSRVGTVPRIVSFIGVGLLMLVIGYVSPLPPQRTEAAG